MLADRYHLHVLNHLHVLKTPREVWRALRYVLLNGRRHASQRAGELLDEASSARWFDGWLPGTVTGDGGRGAARPVARARTWLLGVSWRRYGLLDPAGVPGTG